MLVDWAGDTTGIVDTYTGELIKVYVFGATLPYSGDVGSSEQRSQVPG